MYLYTHPEQDVKWAELKIAMPDTPAPNAKLIIDSEDMEGSQPDKEERWGLIWVGEDTDLWFEATSGMVIAIKWLNQEDACYIRDGAFFEDVAVRMKDVTYEEAHYSFPDLFDVYPKI